MARMRRFKLYCALVVLATTGRLCAQELPKAPEFEAGKEISVSWPGLPNDIRIYTPTNYTTERTWPCVFYYHGTNGNPRTDLVRMLTKGHDYIVVGMEYHIRGQVKMSREAWNRNQRNDFKTYQQVRVWLTKQLKIDPKRVYLGGASKGGWATSSLGEMDLGNLAGLIILMAGRHYSLPLVKDKSLLKGKRVYIGVGEMDLNNISSHWGREFYRKYGAKVCLEEYLGLGHSVSFKSGLLADWFEAQGRLKDNPDGMAGELQAWIDNKTKAIRAETDPAQRYHMLNLLRGNPKLSLCSKEMKQDLRTLWTEATTAGTPGAMEREAETAFRELALKEYYWWQRQNTTQLTATKLTQLVLGLREINGKYGALAKAFPGTRFAKRALAARERIAKPLEHMKRKLDSVSGSRRPSRRGAGATMGAGTTEGKRTQ